MVNYGIRSGHVRNTRRLYENPKHVVLEPRRNYAVADEWIEKLQREVYPGKGHNVPTWSIYPNRMNNNSYLYKYQNQYVPIPKELGSFWGINNLSQRPRHEQMQILKKLYKLGLWKREQNKRINQITGDKPLMTPEQSLQQFGTQSVNAISNWAAGPEPVHNISLNEEEEKRRKEQELQRRRNQEKYWKNTENSRKTINKKNNRGFFKKLLGSRSTQKTTYSHPIYKQMSNNFELEAQAAKQASKGGRKTRRRTTS